MTLQLLQAQRQYRAATGIRFNGTDNGYSRASALVGVSDGSNSVVISYWYLLKTAPGSVRAYTSGSTTAELVGTGISAAGRLNFFYFNQATTDGITWESTATTFSTLDGKWHHVLIAANTAGNSAAQTAALKIYHDDVAVPLNAASVTGTPTDLSANWAADFHSVGYQATSTPTRYWPGLISEMWINIGTYYNFDDPAFRRKFIDERKKPVNLGGFGESVMGSPPTIYLPGGSASTFGINRGTGGDFTATNTPAQTNDSPSFSFGGL